MAILGGIGLVVGTTSSFATIAFVEIVHSLNDLLFVSADSRNGVNTTTLALITIAVLGLGGLLVGIMLHFGVKLKIPLGPAEAIYSVQLRERLPSPLSGFISTLAAMLSLGCGASVGQYGPLVYLGSLIGQLTNRLDLGLRDIRSIAIACGIAAAISTAFNAPIAGLIFTHEVVLRHYSLRIFTAVTVASACGFVVANVVFEHPPLFLIKFNEHFHASEFFLFALEGLACGVLAVGFMKLLQQAQTLSSKIKIHAVFKPMLAGLILGVISLEIPEVLGAGLDVLRQATEANSFSIGELAMILTAKAVVTAICIGFGLAVGVIMPALLIGVLFGALFASSIPELILSDYSGLSVYAVCGMVALASPVIGAPMTALLIIFELTRHYEITVAAMVTIVFANLVSYHWYGRSLFDTQLLRRNLDLSLGRDRAYLIHLKVIDYLSEDRSAHDQPHLPSELQFDENTSLWLAMESMRRFEGNAIPIVHSKSESCLGIITRTEITSAYLDAISDLRREEYEA